MTRPELESLEERLTPAPLATVTLSGSVLTIVGTASADSIGVNSVAGQVSAAVNGKTFTFPAAAVSSISIAGGNGNDLISNNTKLPSVITDGNGNDVIFGSGGGDNITVGTGRDVVYDILGSNTIDAHRAAPGSRVITDATSSVLPGRAKVTTFFQPLNLVNSGSISLSGGSLYITPPTTGSEISIDQVGPNVRVSYDFNDGTGTHTVSFARAQVSTIAFFGNSVSPDVVDNYTAIDEVAYAFAPGDTLFGGTGYDLLKGLKPNDTVIGRGSMNDLWGKGGSDLVAALRGTSILRVVPGDTVIADGSVRYGP